MKQNFQAHTGAALPSSSEFFAFSSKYLAVQLPPLMQLLRCAAGEIVVGGSMDR